MIILNCVWKYLICFIFVFIYYFKKIYLWKRTPDRIGISHQIYYYNWNNTTVVLSRQVFYYYLFISAKVITSTISIIN